MAHQRTMFPMFETGSMKILQPGGLTVVVQATDPLVHLILHQLISFCGAILRKLFTEASHETYPISNNRSSQLFHH
jgi:hypothetical protein